MVKRAVVVLVVAAACLTPAASPVAASGTHAATSSCTAAAECTIALRTGITMAYREVGSSDGPAVILLHGFPDTGLSWSRMLPALIQELPGYHIVIPDLRGHRDSTLPADPRCAADPASCFQPVELARDIVAFMDARGIRRASIVGHSMGTLVAQEPVQTPETVNKPGGAAPSRAAPPADSGSRPR